MFPESNYSQFLIKDNLEQNEKIKFYNKCACCNNCTRCIRKNLKIGYYKFIDNLDKPCIEQIFLALGSINETGIKYVHFYKSVDFKKLLDNCVDTNFSLNIFAITFAYGNSDDFKYLFNQKFIGEDLFELSQFILERMIFSSMHNKNNFNNISENLRFLLDMQPSLVSTFLERKEGKYWVNTITYQSLEISDFSREINRVIFQKKEFRFGFLHFALLFLDGNIIEFILEKIESLGLNIDNFNDYTKILCFKYNHVTCEDYLICNTNIKNKDRRRIRRKISGMKK